MYSAPLKDPETSKTCLRISEKTGNFKWDNTLIYMPNLMPDLHVRHLMCGLGVFLEENIVEWGLGVGENGDGDGDGKRLKGEKRYLSFLNKQTNKQKKSQRM